MHECSFDIFFIVCISSTLWSTIKMKQEKKTPTKIKLILRHFIGSFEWIKNHREFIGGHFDGRCCFLAAINFVSIDSGFVAVFYGQRFDTELWRRTTMAATTATATPASAIIICQQE